VAALGISLARTAPVELLQQLAHATRSQCLVSPTMSMLRSS
jgi:hypothetical protein